MDEISHHSIPRHISCKSHCAGILVIQGDHIKIAMSTLLRYSTRRSQRYVRRTKICNE